MNVIVADTSLASQILEIYTPFIEDGYVTFETQAPDIDAFTKRIRTYSEKYPWLAVMEDGKVLGYAYASSYRERIAYQWVVECSVYVDAKQKKKGIATKLYNALFDLLRAQGFYKAYAVITTPNPESVGFHEKFGFTWFATYRDVGFKAGKWCDVGWWELILREPDTSPAEPILFPNLDPARVKAVLEKYS